MKIECAYDELWPIERLKPNPRNPNKHPDKQIRLLAKVILATGWRSPIVVSERSGYVVKGHGRLLAARVAGFEQVPVDRQAYESEESEMADLVADNRLAELAETDDECMAIPIRNNSAAGDEVYDPFLGSGTTLIAAEQLGRRCYGMELSPVYVDVIIKR